MVYRVVPAIRVQIRVSSHKANSIFRGPPSGIWVVVAVAEADEAGVAVVEAAGEAEGDGEA